MKYLSFNGPGRLRPVLISLAVLLTVLTGNVQATSLQYAQAEIDDGNYGIARDMLGDLLGAEGVTSARAASLLGALYEQGRGGEKDPAFARKLYEYAIKFNDPDALYGLGKMLADGDGGGQDMNRAIPMIQKAMEAGHNSARGLYALWMLQSGKPDYKPLGIDLMKQASEAGHTDSSYQLASYYLKGSHGLPVSVKFATQMLQRAALEGHVQAGRTLYQVYWAGRGVSKDRTRALVWLLITHRFEAQKDFHSLLGKATRTEISDATVQFAGWKRLLAKIEQKNSQISQLRATQR